MPTCLHDHGPFSLLGHSAFSFAEVNQKSKPKHYQRVKGATDRMAKVVIATLSESQEEGDGAAGD